MSLLDFELANGIIRITAWSVCLAMIWLVLYFVYKTMQIENQSRIYKQEDTDV